MKDLIAFGIILFGCVLVKAHRDIIYMTDGEIIKTKKTNWIYQGDQVSYLMWDAISPNKVYLNKKDIFIVEIKVPNGSVYFFDDIGVPYFLN